MTSQDPWGHGGSGDPSLDETRTDLTLGELDASLAAGSGHVGAAEPPAAPAAPPPWSPPAPAQPPGGAAGYTPAPAPGMTWAPPPDTASYAVAGAAGLRFADVFARLVAWVIDIIVLALIGLLVSTVMGATFGASVDWTSYLLSPGAAVSGELQSRILVVSFVGAVIATGIDLAYFVLSWSSAGRATPGMRLLRLQIGDAADGRTLTRNQAFRRWLAMGTWLDVLAALPVIGSLVALPQFLWYIVLLVTTGSSPTRQGMHDRFAGTAVVQPASGSGNAAVIGCLLIIGILVLLAVVSMVALVFLGGQVSTILETMGESI
jgi:uncharacterized RDD family membrane protein YckC